LDKFSDEFVALPVVDGSISSRNSGFQRRAVSDRLPHPFCPHDGAPPRLTISVRRKDR